MAPNAIIRNTCRDVNRLMYVRWRLTGSSAVWLWLAKIIRGSSQQVRTRRGVERGSVAMKGVRQDQPVSDVFFSQVRLANAMIRLWERVIGHNHLAGASQAVGRSIRVGISIFSIVRGLRFEGDLNHVCELWLPVGQALRLLHKLKKPIEV